MCGKKEINLFKNPNLGEESAAGGRGLDDVTSDEVAATAVVGVEPRDAARQDRAAEVAHQAVKRGDV